MASIRETRKILVPVLIGLVVVILACIGYLLSPTGRSRRARQRDLDGLQAQLAAKRQEVLPTRGMDGKLKQASTDIATFYKERFPARILRGIGRAGQSRRTDMECRLQRSSMTTKTLPSRDCVN